MHGRLILVLAAAALAVPTLAPASAAPLFLAPHAIDAALPTAPHAVSNGDEPMILLDKAGTWIWIGDTSQLHRSNDGGATWRTTSLPELPGGFTDGLALAQDDTGVLYAADTNGETISVASSRDGGATWSGPISAAGVSSADYAVGAWALVDRPWLAARGTGELVLTYYAAGAGEICRLSTDGGLTWGAPSVGSPSNAGNLAFDAAGHLYYGVKSATERWDVPCDGKAAQDYRFVGGAQIFYQIAVPSSGAHTYRVGPSNDNGAMQVIGSDGVAHKIVSVSPAVVRSNTFGAIAVKPDDSEIAIAWYGSSTPGDPGVSSYSSSATWNVYVARVTNFWSASPTVTVTTIATGNYKGYYCMQGVSCSGGRALADYEGIAYGPDGKLHLAYGSTESGRAAVYYASLG